MTKLESADIIIKQEGDCSSPVNIDCKKCCCVGDLGHNNCRGNVINYMCLAIAIAYKKEHEND